MKKKELIFYNETKNWDFSYINCITEQITNWDFYNKIQENSNGNSICLDLGTGGGEKLLKKYPNVRLVIGTDFSKEMIKTAKKNLKKSKRKDIKFILMDNLKIKFPKDFFDIISARHTTINAKQIYKCLKKDGILIIKGVDKKDCWELKEIFKRGQGYNDKITISKKDYIDLKNAGFLYVKKEEIIQFEYYKSPEDLMKLLLKTPILNSYKKEENKIEKELLDKYIKNNQTEKGIKLKRVLYGIIAKK